MFPPSRRMQSQAGSRQAGIQAPTLPDALTHFIQIATSRRRSGFHPRVPLRDDSYRPKVALAVGRLPAAAVVWTAGEYHRSMGVEASAQRVCWLSGSCVIQPPPAPCFCSVPFGPAILPAAFGTLPSRMEGPSPRAPYQHEGRQVPTCILIGSRPMTLYASIPLPQ